VRAIEHDPVMTVLVLALIIPLPGSPLRSNADGIFPPTIQGSLEARGLTSLSQPPILGVPRDGIGPLPDLANLDLAPVRHHVARSACLAQTE
jgi:hypothetical protein